MPPQRRLPQLLQHRICNRHNRTVDAHRNRMTTVTTNRHGTLTNITKISNTYTSTPSSSLSHNRGHQQPYGKSHSNFYEIDIRQQKCLLSSLSSNPHEYGYFIWLGCHDDGTNDMEIISTTSRLLSEMKKTKLLLPIVPPLQPTVTIPLSSLISNEDHDPDDDTTTTIHETVYHLIDDHYTNHITIDTIGTMGENDPGVCFSIMPTVTSSSSLKMIDTMYYSHMIEHWIYEIKQHRHGIPFGLYTTGIFDPTSITNWDTIGIDFINIALLGANVKQYQDITGITNEQDAKKAFGYVCSNIIQAVDYGIPVKIHIASSTIHNTTQQQTSLRDLAYSLGVTEIQMM